MNPVGQTGVYAPYSFEGRDTIVYLQNIAYHLNSFSSESQKSLLELVNNPPADAGGQVLDLITEIKTTLEAGRYDSSHFSTTVNTLNSKVQEAIKKNQPLSKF